MIVSLLVTKSQKGSANAVSQVNVNLTLFVL